MSERENMDVTIRGLVSPSDWARYLVDDFLENNRYFTIGLANQIFRPKSSLSATLRRKQLQLSVPSKNHIEPENIIAE